MWLAKSIPSDGLPPAKLHYLDIPKKVPSAGDHVFKSLRPWGDTFHINQYAILALILQQSTKKCFIAVKYNIVLFILSTLFLYILQLKKRDNILFPLPSGWTELCSLHRKQEISKEACP